MSTTRKTWREWDVLKNIKDPDGFRDQPEDTLYTEEEFEERRVRCTLDMRKMG